MAIVNDIGGSSLVRVSFKIKPDKDAKPGFQVELCKAGKQYILRSPDDCIQVTKEDALFFLNQSEHWDVTNPAMLVMKEIGENDIEAEDENKVYIPKAELIEMAVTRGLASKEGAEGMTVKALRALLG